MVETPLRDKFCGKCGQDLRKTADTKEALRRFVSLPFYALVFDYVASVYLVLLNVFLLRNIGARYN